MSGYMPVWVPEADGDWRAYAEPTDYARCRWTMPDRKACGQPGVADLRRGTTQRWSYCQDHLYGRIWRDGRLWTTRWLAPDEQVAVLGLAAGVAADLLEMDGTNAVDLGRWPAAQALVHRLRILTGPVEAVR